MNSEVNVQENSNRNNNSKVDVQNEISTRILLQAAQLFNTIFLDLFGNYGVFVPHFQTTQPFVRFLEKISFVYIWNASINLAWVLKNEVRT